MNPDLDSFLERAFGSVQPTSPDIGRVVVEPDWEVTIDPNDAPALSKQLFDFLSQQAPAVSDLASPEGLEVNIPRKFGLLATYVRRISLHRDKVDGPWVEVAPPGNWI